MTEPSSVDIVSADTYFLSAMQYQLENVLEVQYRLFSDFAECREALQTSAPRVLIIEWNMRDMAAIDFLIRVSEDLSWGEMVVYFVCDHVLTDSEHCQMLSLGTDCAFYKGPGSESIPGFPALITALQEELTVR